MTFDLAIEIVIAWEGGYVNDPDDLGGETNYGITKRQYPHLDIKGLTRATAKAIYRVDYWDRYKVALINNDYRLIYFDMIINQGFKGMSLVMQRALNAKGAELKEDGSFGPKTRTALHTICPDIELIRAHRMKRYIDIINYRPQNRKFLLGWYRRCIAI